MLMTGEYTCTPEIISFVHDPGCWNWKESHKQCTQPPLVMNKHAFRD
jgi:hypothetical protein